MQGSTKTTDDAASHSEGSGGRSADSRVLLADDHALFREGVAFVLKDLAGTLDLVEASTLDEAVAAIDRDDRFDLILLDLRMPGMDGVAGLQRVKSRVPDTPIVIVSAIEERNSILDALQAGAAGYIPKSLTGDVMLGALRLVLAGGVYLPPSILDAARSRGGASRFGHGEGEASENNNRKSLLTPRQSDVLALLAKGRSNKEIARELDLSVGTVKLHVTALLKALEASNRTQAVIKAAQMGILDS